MGTSAKMIFFAFLQIVIFSIYTHFIWAQLVSDFRVNDDTTNTEQFSAKIGVDSLGIVTAVWRDQRNNRPNIYCQRFNSNGAFSGQNFRININPDSSGSPAVAVSKNGMFGICWVEINSTINNSSKVKFRLYNSLALPLTGEIIVNDTNGNFSGPLSVGVNNENEFTIVWEQKNILFQKIDSIGNKIANNTKVNDDTGNNTHKNPAITVRQDGSFIITWNDTRPLAMDNADDIYMQMYDRFGNKVGVNQRVNDDTSPFNLQQTPKISSETLGNFIISWTDNRIDNDYTEIFGQMYFNTGVKDGNNFRVTLSSLFYSKGVCNVVKRPNGEFLVTWGEFRQSIPLPYFQRYTNSGIRIGNDFLVTSEYPSVTKYYSDVTIFGNRIISVWTDSRNGPFDIYCNIRSFTNPDTTVSIQNISSVTPSEFKLYQNYPNPFNNQTNIVFEVVNKNNYTLEIFNTLGRVVDKFDYNNLNPGKYNITYDASGLSSGVYYYSMNYGGSYSVKKFVLLK